MKQHLRMFLYLICFIWLGTDLSHAQNLVSWNFADEPGNQEFTIGTGSDNIIPLNFTRGDGLSANTGGESLNSSSWPGEGNKYLSFGFLVSEGYQVKLSNLVIKTRSSGTGPGNLALRSSLDGFVSDLATWSQVGTADNTQTIELSSLPNLLGEVEFRIYAVSTVSAGGGTLAATGTFRVTNFSTNGTGFNGTVSLVGEDPIDPEPIASTLAQWDFVGEPGNQAFTSGTGSDQVSANNFTRGAGLVAGAANNSISSSSWSITDLNDYYTFGFEVEEGFEVELEELILATRSSAAGPGSLALRYNGDGFTENIATWTNTGTAFSNEKIDLSNLGKLTGPVEFRIVLNEDVRADGAAGSIQSGGTLRVANFAEGGSVFSPVRFTGILSAIPVQEPEPIVNWNFTGEPGNQTSTAADFEANGLVALDFTRGAGINAASANNSISSNGWNTRDDRYFSFGFSIAPDKLVDLSAIQIGTRSSGTGPRDMALLYSGDGFQQPIASWTQSNNAFDNFEFDLSGLNNLSGTVEFRIVSTSNISSNDGTVASTGTFRVTNFFPANVGTTFIGIVKDLDGVSVPTLTPSTSTLNFGSISLNQASPILSYELAAMNLNGPVIVTAPENTLISKDGEEYTGTLEFSIVELSTASTIFVKINELLEGTISGNIIHSTAGTIPVNVALSGTIFDPFNISENFNEACASGGLPTGWSAVSVLGNQIWACTTFGRAGTTPTASAPSGLQINGFAAGGQLNEDWLITPAYDLSDYDFPLLSFWSRVAFTGPRLKLMVSTDYVDGDPNLATWTELSDRFANGDTWTSSGEINLSAFKAENVRIAFVFTSSPETNAARWTLDDFALTNSQTAPAPFLSNNIGNVDYWHFGIIPSGTVSSITRSFNFSLSDAIEDLTISAGEGFELSKNGTDFSNSLTYDATSANGNNTVTIRFAPTAAGAFSSPITFESGDILVRRGYVTGATVERDETFDVVTWNVEWFGSTASGQGPTNVDQQLQNVKTIIEDLDADVYAFQEITSFEKFNELADALEGYEGLVSPAVSQGPDAFETGQKLTFLYKKETVELIKTKVLLEGVKPEDLVGYPAPPDRFWASGRLPFLMEVKANINGVQQYVNLVNVHTRSNGGGESAANPRYAMRRYDVNVLKDSLDQYYGNVPLILLGDFNDDLDETVADQFAATVNTSETSFINYINDPENYVPVSLTLSNAGLRSFPTFENVIDHIIVSDEMRENWLVNSERIVAPFDLVNNYSSTTSDHIPVKARFSLRCDIIPAQIIGDSELCFGQNTLNLILVGGEYAEVLGWEVSEDAGQSWNRIPETEGMTSISLENLRVDASFRAVLRSNLCQANTELFEVSIQSLPEPVILFEAGYLISIEGDYVYHWFKDDVLIATTSENRIRIQGTGNYRVTIENALGCQAVSETFRFPRQLQSNSIRVYPNPSSYIVSVIIRNAEGMTNIELRTSAGSRIQNILTDSGYAEFDVSTLAKGIYLIVITDQYGQSVVERLIVD